MAILAPIFFLLIFLEYRASKKRERKLYISEEGFSHIMTLAGQQVFNLFYFALTFIPYRYIHQNLSFFEWQSSFLIQFMFTFIAVDFLWYWAHRASHRVNIFIASHTTHHQAEDYNLLSSFRQSWTSRLVIFIFFVPMAFFGIAPEIIMATQLLSIFIQFLTHLGIKHISFGPLDYIFISPAAHYAHHGVNRPYLDKNYGGVFSIWDHLFGTYVFLDLKSPPVIGLKDKINHYDPVEANLNYYKRMWFVSLNAETLKEKVMIYFQTPEYLSSKLREFNYREKARKPSFSSLNARDLKSLFVYAVLQLVFSVTVVTLWSHVDWGARLLLSSFVIGLIVMAGRQLCLLASDNKLEVKDEADNSMAVEHLKA